MIESRLPREFVQAPEYTQRVARVVLYFGGERSRQPRDETMGFTPFPASRERDVWQQRVCEKWFYPLRHFMEAADAAQFVGDGCTAADIGAARVHGGTGSSVPVLENGR